MKESESQAKKQTTSEFASENMGYGIAAVIVIAAVGGYYFYTRPKNSPVKVRNDSNEVKSFVEKFSMD